MNNEYIEAIKKLADDDRTELERGDILIREMCRLTSDLLDYRNAVENYKGKGTVLNDLLGTIANSMALLMSDLDIYAEYMDITDKVAHKKENRVIKLAKKKVGIIYENNK